MRLAHLSALYRGIVFQLKWTLTLIQVHLVINQKMKYLFVNLDSYIILNSLSPLKEQVIQKNDEIRLKIIGLRIDATDIVSYWNVFLTNLKIIY